MAALAAIRNQIDDLHGFLVAWHHPRAGQEEQHRRAGAEALSAVDSLLSELHGIRAEVAREIAANDRAWSGRPDASESVAETRSWLMAAGISTAIGDPAGAA